MKKLHADFYEYALKVSKQRHKPTYAEMAVDLGFASASGVYRLAKMLERDGLFKTCNRDARWTVKDKKGNWI